MHETYDRDILELVGPARVASAINPRLGIVGGGLNAGLLAVQILATRDPALRNRVERFKVRLAAESRAEDARLRRQIDSDTSA